MNSSTSTRLIPLTQGQYALVDADDYEWLMQWKWVAERRGETNTFYAKRRAGKREPNTGSTIYMHRQIIGLDIGDPRECDHKEPSAPLDNRKANLRTATRLQNMWNRRSPKGVCLRGARRLPSGNYAAYLKHNKRTHYLGTFQTEQLAHAAYAAEAIRLRGEFARVAS